MGADQSVITGVVRDPTGQPVPQARVYFTDGPVPLPEIAALTDRAGAFSLTAPAPGTYRIECRVDGFASTAITVSVAGGRTIHQELRLQG